MIGHIKWGLISLRDSRVRVQITAKPLSNLLIQSYRFLVWSAQDMFVRSWLLTPVRTLRVEAYENQGTTAVPDYVLRSTYTRRGGPYYLAVSRVLGRTHPETGLPLFDFLLTNGSETVYVMRNNVSVQLTQTHNFVNRI